jgi:hypothetical protein
MTLEQVQQGLIDYLVSQDIHAIPAWQKESRKAHRTAVAVVSLKSLELTSLGQQNYLGERVEEGGTLRIPIYGRKLALTFGLDLYAPKGEAEQCHALFAQLGQALCLSGPEGLTVEKLCCGEIRYDSEADCLTCSAELVTGAWCYLTTQEDGEEITEFIVKGDTSV